MLSLSCSFDPKSNKPFYNSTLVLFFKELMQANATAIGSFEVRAHRPCELVGERPELDYPATCLRA